MVGAIYLDRGYDACMYFMQKRILAQMINIDKVAYKEVNFKSKLIEWSQKNRVKLAQNAPVEEKHINVFKEEVFTEKSAETAQETEVQVEMKDEKRKESEVRVRFERHHGSA